MIEVTRNIIGKKVIFTNSSLHKKYPDLYPESGTVGVVVAYISLSCSSVYVQWPKGATSESDLWACDKEHLDPYKKDVSNVSERGLKHGRYYWQKSCF